ncbi:MAG: DUF4163 domain-containing protein [Ruminococcaceae bacterium]|nr:DUF4163 domain-containing protein [Oscillospiraceae bacterium]
MSAKRKRKRHNHKPLYITIFAILLVLLIVTVIIIPKKGGEEEKKDEQTEKQTTVFDAFEENKDNDETEAQESEEETETPEPVLPDVPVTTEKSTETDEYESAGGGIARLTVNKPVFSAEEYGENADRLNELIDLKTDSLMNEYSRLIAMEEDFSEDREYTFDYQISYNDNGIVSFLYYEHTGTEVDAKRYYGSINFDMNKGNSLTVTDLLPETDDPHSNILEAVMAEITASADNYSVSDLDTVAALYENYHTQFVTDNETITVFFQPGDLNESNIDITEFTFTLDSLK